MLSAHLIYNLYTCIYISNRNKILRNFLYVYAIFNQIEQLGVEISRLYILHYFLKFFQVSLRGTLKKAFDENIAFEGNDNNIIFVYIWILV